MRGVDICRMLSNERIEYNLPYPQVPSSKYACVAFLKKMKQHKGSYSFNSFSRVLISDPLSFTKEQKSFLLDRNYLPYSL